METDDDTELQKFFKTDEYRDMSYIERNRGFLTNSKCRIHSQDEWWFKLMYVDEIPQPYALDTQIEALLLGSCLDDLRTHGREYITQKYEVMSRTVSNIEDAIQETLMDIEKQKDKVSKRDGSRLQSGIDREKELYEHIAFLNNLKGKKQLTNSQWQMVLQMDGEFSQNALFRQKPEKMIIIFKIGNIPCKVELDDYDPHFTNDETGAQDFHAIIDMKSTASITTFDPVGYLEQFEFYQMAIEMRTFKNEPVWDSRPICAIAETVDKHGLWSRSQAYYYSPERLKDARAPIMQKLQKCWNSVKTNRFYKSKEFLPDCPYYGYEGYGRATKFLLVP